MKNKMLINGIDDIIKGLTTIKGILLVSDETDVRKEALASPILELIGHTATQTIQEDKPVIEEVNIKVVREEKPKKEVKAVEEEPVEEPEEVDEEDEEEVEEESSEKELDIPYSRKELEAMSYNELKVLAGTVKGIDAKGKKQELVEKILNALGESSEEIEEAKITSKIKLVDASTEEVEEDEEDSDEEENEEVEYSEEEAEEFKEFLSELEVDELKAIAKEAGFKVNDKVVKVKLVEKLLIDLDLLVKCLESLGYYDDEEAIEEIMNDTESDKQKIVNMYNLDEYTVEELADICSEFDLSTSGKKQTLIDRIVKGILDGTIEFEDEEDEETTEEEVTEEVNEVDDKKVESEEESEEVEVDPKVLAKEEEVEANIRAKYKSKKLKDSEIKKFLDKYTDGDPECAGCKDCSKEDLLNCYIEIHRNLVDDEGDVSELEEPYIRQDEYHCCGVELSEALDSDNMFCKICGQEYTK